MLQMARNPQTTLILYIHMYIVFHHNFATLYVTHLATNARSEQLVRLRRRALFFTTLLLESGSQSWPVLSSILAMCFIYVPATLVVLK